MRPERILLCFAWKDEGRFQVSAMMERSHEWTSNNRILEVLLTWVELQPEHFYGEGLDEFKNFVKTVMLEKDGNKAKPLYKKISKTDINPEVIVTIFFYALN